MFDKKILKEDLEQLKVLKAQKNNCGRLIKESYNFILNNDLADEDIFEEKITIKNLVFQYQDLQSEIKKLEHFIYLNYINQYYPSPQKVTGLSFPHITSLN